MHAVCRADRSVQQFYPRQCCSNTSGAAAALPWTSPVTSETAAVLPQTWQWCYLRCDGRYDVLDIARSLYQPQQQTLWCHLSPSLWRCYHNHGSSSYLGHGSGSVTSGITAAMGGGSTSGITSYLVAAFPQYFRDMV